eukprot:755587-Hanusia_phi.AAC.7
MSDTASDFGSAHVAAPMLVAEVASVWIESLLLTRVKAMRSASEKRMEDLEARRIEQLRHQLAVLDQKREQSECPLAIQSRHAQRLERTRTVEAERERIRAQADRRIGSMSPAKQGQMLDSACTIITQRVKVSESQPLGNQPRESVSKKEKQDYGQTRFHAVQIFRHNHQNANDDIPRSLFDNSGQICIVNAHEAAKAVSMIHASHDMQRSVKLRDCDKKAKQRSSFCLLSAYGGKRLSACGREAEARQWLERQNTANRVMKDLEKQSSKHERYYRKIDGHRDNYLANDYRKSSDLKLQKQKEHDLIDALLGPMDHPHEIEKEPTDQALSRDRSQQTSLATSKIPSPCGGRKYYVNTNKMGS